MKKLLSILTFLLLATPASAVVQTTKMPNAAYQVQPTDTMIVTQQAFTAARTLTLPSASSFGTGSGVEANSLTFFDSANTITTTNTLTVTPQSGETINGSTSSIVINLVGSQFTLYPITGSGWVMRQTSTISGGSWTPVDSSGAALVFTGVSASYSRIGNMVFAYAQFAYPVTADGTINAISGFPFTVANANYAQNCAVTYTNLGSAIFLSPNKNTITANFYSVTTGSTVANSVLSGKAFQIQCVYPVS